MTYFRFFLLFVVTYFISMALGGIIAALVGIGSASSLNTPLLFGVSFWCINRFSEKNARIVQGNGKWKVVFIALLADILVSFLLAVPLFLSQGKPVYYLLFGVLVIAPLHLLLLISTCYFVKKSILKKHPEWAQS